MFTNDADINEHAIYVDGGGVDTPLFGISTGDFIGSGTNNFPDPIPTAERIYFRLFKN